MHSSPFCTKIYVLFAILRKTSSLHVITLSLFQFKCGQNLSGSELPEVGFSYLSADISLPKSSLLICWKKLALLQCSFQSCFVLNIVITLCVITSKGPHERSLSLFGWASWSLAGMQNFLLRLCWKDLTIRKWQDLRLHTPHKLCSLMHMYYNRGLKYMVNSEFSHNMYFL